MRKDLVLYRRLWERSSVRSMDVGSAASVCLIRSLPCHTRPAVACFHGFLFLPSIWCRYSIGKDEGTKKEPLFDLA